MAAEALSIATRELAGLLQRVCLAFSDWRYGCIQIKYLQEKGKVSLYQDDVTSLKRNEGGVSITACSDAQQ